MPRVLVWQPVACPSEGFNAPIGDVCLQLWSGSRPCLRTLGGELLKKNAFMEELGLEDVPARSLVVVQRRPDGGWQQLGTINTLTKQPQLAHWQAPAAGHAALGGKVIDLTVSPEQQAAAAPAVPQPPRQPIDLTVPAAAAPAAAALQPRQPPDPHAVADRLARLQPFGPEPQHPRLAAPAPAAVPLPPQRLVPPVPAVAQQPGPAAPALRPPAVQAAPPPLPPAAPAVMAAPRLQHAPAEQPPAQRQQQPAVQRAAPNQHRALPPPQGGHAAVQQPANHRIPRLPWLEARPLQPPPAAAPARSPLKMAAPAQLVQARGSSTRRRSLLACPACKSVRRGAAAGEAAEALACPVCYCEADEEPQGHTHLDCGHPYCNACLANYLHSAYQGGTHPKCQKPGCEQLLSEEDLQQGVLVLCDCPDVRQQRSAARLPPLDDPLAAYQRFTALAAAALAREGGDLIECQRCHFMILVEEDAPEDAPCPNCRRGKPLLEARQAAECPRGIQQVEGERVLYCPSCAFGPQQKAMHCNKLKCGGCGLLLCWCCGEVIGEQRVYDHFADDKCPLYGLPGERPEMTAAEQEAAQERAVQREAYYQQMWDLIVHPAHRAVRGMRRATPPDMQADDALWQRVHNVMHSRLERAFNEITEAAAAREEQLPVLELQAQLLPRAGTLLDAAWPGWDVWEGVVGDVLRALNAALIQAANARPAGRQHGAPVPQPAQQPAQQPALQGLEARANGMAPAAERQPAQQQAQQGLAHGGALVMERQQAPQLAQQGQVARAGGEPAAAEQQQARQQAQQAQAGRADGVAPVAERQPAQQEAQQAAGRAWMQRALAAVWGRGGPVQREQAAMWWGH